MEIISQKIDVLHTKCDLLAIGVFEGFQKLEGCGAMIDLSLQGKLSEILVADRFKAKPCTTLLIHTFGRIPARRVLVIGMGDKKNFDLEVIRQCSAASVNVAKELHAKKVIFAIQQDEVDRQRVCDFVRVIVEGARLADYSFSKFKKQNGKTPNDFIIVSVGNKFSRQVQKGIELGELFAQATMLARDLVNTPAKEMNPERLVNEARAIAKGRSSISVRVFDVGAIKKMGAGGILGVSCGSDSPPFLVHMIYKPIKKAKKRIALVGKAVTFDSGGLSLKPADFMTNMKCDMAGSADVLGVFNVIDKIAPSVEVHGIFAAVENMPSGHAIRPGDVLTLMNKKTIEVLNTDAEGRITLADSIIYALKQKPDIIIDLATLTGACMVALGEEITGLMSNDDRLASKIFEASVSAGEKIWRLPLEKNYKKLLKSNVADLQNIGNKWGGALTAGLFLEEFVGDTQWAHLDIAGPAFAERDIDPYTKKGATGHGVRTVLSYLKSI